MIIVHLANQQYLLQKKNRIVTCSHIVNVLIIMFLSIQSGKKQISLKLIEKHYKNMFALGVVKESWNKNIVCFCRRWLSENNIISFVEQKYNPSYVKADGEIVEGQACIYDMDTDLINGLTRIRNGKAGGGTLCSTAFQSLFSMPKSKNIFCINRLQQSMFDPIDLENWYYEPKLAA